jgi:hypothetical protein
MPRGARLEETRNVCKFFVENTVERESAGDGGMDVRVILKWILEIDVVGI